MRLKLGSKISRIFHKFLVVALVLCFGKAYAQEITAIDFNGDLIGKVIPDGKVVSFENQLIGNITADSLIVDFDGRLIGGVVPRGIAIGNDNRMLGKVSNDGTVRLATGKIIGKVLPNGLVVDEKFDILGAVVFPGLIYSDDGKTLGRLTGDGVYANLQGQTIGFVSSDGYAYRSEGDGYKLDGRLISSKMVVDATGRFIGSISPGGKITNLDGNQIGFIKANGLAYDSDNKVIGRVVSSGYAFDKTGKYIGLVTFNGEVVNNEKLVGYLQIDDSIADSSGNIIGFMVDLSATASDASGRYLGRIMPEGKIARGRNIIGSIGPSKVVFNAQGKQIGRSIITGPVFDYRGTLRAQALKNGQVILPTGTPLGVSRGNLAFNTSGKIVGAVLKNQLVINANNTPLGINGVNSVLSMGEDVRIVSPFGYVYNAEGGIDGNALTLGDMYDLGGARLGSVSPNGEVMLNGTVQNGIITQYGYNIDDKNAVLGGTIKDICAVDAAGKDLGILSLENSILNNNMKQTAKILPDGSVVSSLDNKSYMPVIGKAMNVKLAVRYDGTMLGYVDNQGIVRDDIATIIGRVNSEDIVLDNNGNNIGEVVDFQTIINDKCEFVGVVAPSGEIKNYREVTIGKILPNRQVVSESGKISGFGVVAGIVGDWGGNSIATTTSGGKVLNYTRESQGCLNIRHRVHSQNGDLIGKVLSIAPVIDFEGKIVGRSMLNGSVIDDENRKIGYVLPDDSVNSSTGSVLGMLFKYRYAFDNDNKILGTVNGNGEVVNNKGAVVGTVDFEGNVVFQGKNIGYALYDMYMYDNNYAAIGYIVADGGVMSFGNQKLGQMIRGFAIDNNGKMFARGNRDFLIRNKNNGIIGELQLDGQVVDNKSEQIGTLKVAGDIEAVDGQIIATAKPLQYYETEKRQPVYDANGNVIGYVGANNKIVDANGNVVGSLAQDGSVVSPDGVVIGNTKLDWYERPVVSGQKLPEVGSIKVSEKDYKRSVNIALTPDGEYLGDILDDGTVINKSGKVLGKVLPDGLVVDDQGSLIGIEESAKKSEQGDVFVPAGSFGDGGAYGTGTGPGNLGPGGGFGPGERYDVQRSAALSVAQGERRKNMEVGKISTGFSKEDFDGKQKDWGLKKVVSTLPVDMDMMILADKPIPAVIARSIDTEHEVPVTAFVERNVYAEDGRNIIIPAGSRLIGSCGGGSGSENASASARIAIQWERLIMPNGVMFDMSSAQSGDAQGRGGVLGYLDRQLMKKYAMPFATSLANSGLSILFATGEKSKTDTETSKQQAMNDARDNFLSDTRQMFQQILQDRANIRAITFIPAGTRIIVYPKADLWLRTPDNASDGENREYKNVLIDDQAMEAKTNSEKAARNKSVGQSSSVVYEADESDAEPARPLIDDAAMAKQSKKKRSGSALPPPPPPSTGVVNTGSSSGGASGGDDVPQLF